MDGKELEKILLGLHGGLYALGMAVTERDAVAERVCLDALELLKVRDWPMVEKLAFGQWTPGELKKTLCERTYNLAMKSPSGGARERAILILKMTLKLDIQSIEQISGCHRYEIFSHLATSRESVLRQAQKSCASSSDGVPRDSYCPHRLKAYHFVDGNFSEGKNKVIWPIFRSALPALDWWRVFTRIFAPFKT